ncbi:DJ-1/PfpI family protein [Paraburkholderia acidicola]|uniref:DJ-1/PfpI family protein n=1 Tax=Paraburkholderia acidicola TaxID=1912599 RepID=A0ABV1LWT0_9BURK
MTNLLNDMEHDFQAVPAPVEVHVAMLVFPGFTLLDLVGPQTTLSFHTTVHLVAKTLEPVASDSGIKLVPTCTFADCPQNVDVLFVPGGFGTADAMEDEETIAFLRDRGARARFVTSVCTGSLIQAAAGLLEGYEATTYWAHLDILRVLGAKPIAKRVVMDRGRISGGGVTAGIDFGLSLLAELRGDLTARTMQLLMEYDPAPPFDCGNPEDAGPEVAAQAKAALGDAVDLARAAAYRIRAKAIAD